MAVSNDWQNISGMTYKSIGHSSTIWTKTSAQNVANAIGWEVVHASDYVETITRGDFTYNASEFYFIRPVADADEDEYNVGLLYATPLYSSAGSASHGILAFNISNGELLGSTYMSGAPATWKLFRPTANGGMFIKISDAYRLVIDKFYNPKTGWSKWGVCAASQSYNDFIDVYTGLVFSRNTSSSQYKVASGSPPFVSLKKFTAIAGAGVFNAKSVYASVYDYNTSSKVIELDGKTYVGMSGYSSTPPFYIPLSD